MKITTEQAPQFNPITVTIRLQSEEEVQAFYALWQSDLVDRALMKAFPSVRDDDGSAFPCVDLDSSGRGLAKFHAALKETIKSE